MDEMSSREGQRQVARKTPRTNDWQPWKRLNTARIRTEVPALLFPDEERGPGTQWSLASTRVQQANTLRIPADGRVLQKEGSLEKDGERRTQIISSQRVMEATKTVEEGSVTCDLVRLLPVRRHRFGVDRPGNTGEHSCREEESMARRGDYSPEVRERAIRMVSEHQAEYNSLWAAIVSIAGKIGRLQEALRRWIRQVEIDSGERDGQTTEDRARIKELERENRELRRSKQAQRDEVLSEEIERVRHENHAVYGARKVWKQLRRKGIALRPHGARLNG